MSFGIKARLLRVNLIMCALCAITTLFLGGCEETAVQTTVKSDLSQDPDVTGLRHSIDDGLQVLKMWGEGDPEADTAAVEFIESRGYRGEPALDAVVWNAASSKVRARPEMICQFVWHVRWNCRNVTYDASRDSGYFCSVIRELDERSLTTAERARWIFLLASMVNRPEIVCGTTYQQIDARWEELMAELRNTAMYYVFDYQEGHFRLDAAAMLVSEPVPIDAQAMPAVTSPVPLLSSR